jgi:hypothetical protein
VTRRELMLIAETITALDLAAEARAHVTTRFASMLARSEPRFHRDRFVAACDPYRALRAKTGAERDADATRALGGR